MEKHIELKQEANRHLKIADHMLYVTYGLVNEKRLLIKIFDEIYKTVYFSICSIVYWDIYRRKINSSLNNEEIIEYFFNVFPKEFNLNENLFNNIKEILEINNNHKKSAIEFVKKEKIVIMADDLDTLVLDINSIKKYLGIAKELYSLNSEMC